MPIGDADRIHEHCGGLTQAARDVGKDAVSIRVGDVRDALALSYSDAVNDICQVLSTAKFSANNRAVFTGKSGPKEGLNTTYTFDLLE